jgi:AraC family transcriptional regulator, regulatory protein of adaptative response / methylated-DNA-[protein]-cysteine methyltransferase
MTVMTPGSDLPYRSMQQENAVADVLFYATGKCLLGALLVARSAKGVRAILLGDDAINLERDLAERFPSATLAANEAMVRDDLAMVSRLAANPSENVDLALDMRGTTFQRRVWEAVRSIPAGQTRSYLQVGRLMNPVYPRVAARLVANACAANPLALVIPCHRVVRSDGTLAGYRWGLDRKRDLIEREAVA